MAVYYNENDPYAAACLEELIKIVKCQLTCPVATINLAA